MITDWRAGLLDQLRSSLAGIGRVAPYGSVAGEAELDDWSDLDVAVELGGSIALADLGIGPVWAWQDSVGDHGQTLRLVLRDDRRLDLSMHGGVVAMPTPTTDNAVRFDAALAAVRYGRGDRLIGLHLTLGVLRECLVIAMLLRDRAEGTDRHRHGTELDDRAAEVARIAAAPDAGDARPTPVEQACRLYGRWRAELHPDYRPDWSGLTAVIDRGTGTAMPR